VVIVHGIGVHPDPRGDRRAALEAHRPWLTTLSIQMPVQAADARLRGLLPGAVSGVAGPDRPRGGLARRQGGAEGRHRFPQPGRVDDQHLLRRERELALPGLGLLGLTGGYSLATWFSPRPILDVYGENDLEPSACGCLAPPLTLASAPEGSRQVMIAGTDHFYAGKEDELARTISGWLGEVLR